MTGRKKTIAVFFVAALAVQDFYPAAAYALTSGPAQPEMEKFQPAGVSDAVDLFTGDFHYDIPLLDVDGYPLNLTYHSGTHMEDEAGWVGMGWSLNPGSMNRTVRGLPDDFTGDNSSTDPADAIQSTQYRKNFVKIGGQITLKGSLFGWPYGSGSLHLGVYKDNYYGIGADIGASVSFQLAQNSSSPLTASLGLSSDTRQGVTLSPSFTLSAFSDAQKEGFNIGLSGGFAYNTREGLKSVNLGQSFNTNSSGDFNHMGYSAKVGFAGFAKTFAHTYTPSFSTNTVNSSQSFNFDLGPEALGGYIGVGGTGYEYTETNVEPYSSIPAYGYLHYVNGRKNPAALLDFNREKDGAFMTTAPAIPIPVVTEDYFEATNQVGSEEFRPVYNGNYIVYDRPFTNTSASASGGFTIGAGDIEEVGLQADVSNGQAVTHAWTSGDYINAVTPSATNLQQYGPYYESVYFKKAGEQTKMCPPYYNAMWTDNTQKVAVSYSGGGTSANAEFVGTNGTSYNIQSPITRPQRDVRTSTFTYLTALQASQYGLDKTINGSPRVDQINIANPVSTVHKPHHMSEVTVTDKDGKRMVYGIPVYNTDQEEVAMSVAGVAPTDPTAPVVRRNGLIGYTPGTDNTVNNRNGRENIYNRKIVPPYATSFLLTGILSPDYVDLTGNGISDDDLGTAIKFHYKKSPVTYKWRAPFEANQANYNEGFLYDQTDDKGNYTFGTRELWYLDTIRSKTMEAVFITSARNDGLGVLGENGGPDITNTLQELDTIKLFSTADLMKNGANATPIKSVIFTYDYSLYPGMPNDKNGASGKLTLKKVQFTFGNSTRALTNPYIFAYDMRTVEDGSIANLPADTIQAELTDQYAQRQSDRWGTYKQSYFNNIRNYMNNGEFPYSIQATDNGAYDERMLADRFASKWQLNSITTPTGGVISVQYESDDYSYVQDQQAMIMCPMSGVGSAGVNTGMINSNLIYVTVPVSVSSPAAFVSTYLNGPNGQNLDNIFYKVKADVDGKQHWEYVYGYAEIDYSQSVQPGPDGHTWGIPVKKVNGYNPISMQAWQMIQTDLPQWAYPDYDNSDASGFGGNVEAAVESIVAAFIDLRELFESFDQIASHSHFANNIDPTTSLIRLNYPVGLPNGPTSHRTYGKLGGGSRVSQIEISDDWNTMVGGKSVAYGVKYDYTATDDKGDIISSGVASYEPEIGNEENPFRQPVDYTEKVEWGLDRYHYMEKPFGESYFPAPVVGYSQVKATEYGIDHSSSQPAVSNTGYRISQFYTSRDFPTQVDYLPLEEDNYENDLTLLLFASQTINRVTTTQGFKVIDNDMHGKQKSVQTYDNGGTLITSKDFFYQVNDPNAQRKTLNNTVPAMNTDGTIPGAGMLIATDAELITDMRESNSSNTGVSAGLYAGVTVFPFFIPIVIPFIGGDYDQSGSLRTYNSVSTIKVIHQYGLLKEVKTTQNGSSLTADNLLWDAQTGAVLLARNQNEFNDYTYALNYPAYRAYNGMSSAYENIGTVFSGFSTNTDGTVATPASSGYLAAGDELVDIDPGMSTRGWLMQSGDGTLRFIDQTGNFIYTTGGTFMVIRSGRRNMLNAAAGSVVTMNNPLVLGGSGYILQANVDANVLDTKALTYKDEWGQPVPNFMTVTTNGQEQLMPPPPLSFGCNIKGAESNGPPVTCSPDYTIDASGSAPTCGVSVFEGAASRGANQLAVPLRTYLDFGTPTAAAANVPSNGVITDVTLTLTAATDVSSTPTQGQNNSAVIDRVTSPNDCSYTTWTSQPSTTNVGEAILPQPTGSAQNYTIDVTSMYNDWAAGYTLGGMDFDLVIRLANESLPIARHLIFDGASGANPPMLTFYYTIYGQCTNPVNQIFNPYYAGVKGNWRPCYNYAYQVTRTENTGNVSQAGGTNIRTSGYYSSYTPFWMFTNAGMVQIPPVVGSAGFVADPRWVWESQSVYYDQKGNAVEEVNALNNSSAALFGYDQSLETAVAANARHNEIAFEGFEDYYFNLLETPTIPCPLSDRQLNMGFALQGGQYCSGGNCIVSTMWHTGNYSLQLGGTLSVTATGGSASAPGQFVGFDDAGHSILLANEQAGGFAPISGKNYLLSLWVNDGNPNSNLITGLQVNINGSAVNLSNMTVPVVEGWKQLNVNFTATGNFSLTLTGGGSTYIDDLRLMPFDAQMKTFVYDDQTLRFMGQLDENNFATLYEYDEEGTPIRVKKETERGMMTVKENRQSLVPQY
jgi:hypothetical protein